MPADRVLRLRVLILLVIACGVTAVLAAPRTDFTCLAQRALHAGDPGYAGWSCAHYAAIRGDLQALRRMLEYGADVDQRNAAGRTPLAEAAKRGRLDAIRLLLARGAEVNVYDRAELTPLHLAAQAQHAAVARRLLIAGANPNARNQWQQTPLWLAAWQAWEPNTEIAHSLVAQGADIGLADENGNTPLHMAARAGHEAMVGYLLREGAAVDRANARGRTPLYQAAIGNHLRSARLLLRHGADPNVAVGADGWTPLRAALADGHQGMADLLAAHGARGYERFAAAARLDHGYSLLQDQRVTEALAAFDQAIALRPDDARAYYYRGLARLRQGAPERALTDFNRTLRLEPGHTGALERAGLAHAERGEYERAVDSFQQLVQRRPEYGRGHHLLAESLRGLGLADRARRGERTACRLGYRPACAGGA